MNPDVPRFHPFPSKTTVERSIANHEIDFPGRWRRWRGWRGWESRRRETRGREVNFMICDRALDRCFRGKWMKSRDFWVHISASAKQGMERLCKGRRSRFRRVVRLPCLQQAAEAAANHLQNEYLKLLSMLLCFHARDVRSSKVFEGLTGSWLKHLPLLFIIRILQVKTNAMQCNRQQSH